MLGKLAIAFMVVAFLQEPLSAKRLRPKPVAPVVSKGVEYSADGDGIDAYVVATDIATGKEIWKVRVFHTFTKPQTEQDVQYVFITHLTLANKALLVRDERARCYEIGLRKHNVKDLGDCSK
jgi:hypothetical protein